jgi:hypothetical protein
MDNDKLNELKAIATGISSAEYDLTFWSTNQNVVALITEVERLRLVITELANAVIEEEAKCVGPEGPSSTLVDMASSAIKSLSATETVE